MRKHLALAGIIILNTTAHSQWVEVKQTQLVTFGSATVTYPPDRVRFSFGVRGLGSTVEQAIKQATDRVRRIATKLRGVGIADRQIQTSHFNSADNPDGKGWWSSSEDIAAAFEMVITIDSVFDLVEPAITALSGEPVENVSHLQFSLRDDAAKRLEACNKAAEDARRKAERLAATLGTTITDVLFVEDISQGQIPLPGIPMRGTSSVLGLQAGVPRSIFSPTQIPVDGRVKVIFAIGHQQQLK